MASREPLTDKATVKGKRGLDLSTTDWDSAIDAWIREASYLITDLIGRNLHRVSNYTESIGSRGGFKLYVRDHLPVVSLSKVEHDGNTVDAADYHLGAASEGEIVHDGGGWQDTSYAAGMTGTRRSPRPPEKLYDVTYEGGYVTPVQAPFGSDNDPRDLPDDIEAAVIDYCVMKYRQQGRDLSVKSKSFGSGSIEWTEIDGRRVPVSLADAVNRHRKPVIS